MNSQETSPDRQPRCRNLRSKEMFHQAPGQEDDQFSSGVFWCSQTQENFGPDGQPAGKNECCPGRSCYVS